MAKNAVRVAVRNVVRVVKAPPGLAAKAAPALAAKARMADRQVRLPDRPASLHAPELLSGVSWDEGRKVWLVHPVPAPGRG